MGLGQQVKFLASPPRLYTGAVVGNWQSGLASSGQPGDDFLLIGAPDTIYYPLGIFGIPIILIWIGDLTPGATITYRTYLTAFGALRFNYDDDYVVGVDEDIMAVAIWTGHGQARIEIMSDDPLDNGTSIPYEYSLKTY